MKKILSQIFVGFVIVVMAGIMLCIVFPKSPRYKITEARRKARLNPAPRELSLPLDLEQECQVKVLDDLEEPKQEIVYQPDWGDYWQKQQLNEQLREIQWQLEQLRFQQQMEQVR